MTRKTAAIVIENGRDKGQQFLVSEMSATDGARLAFQMFQLLAAAGVDVDIQKLSGAEIIKVVMRLITTLHPEDFDAYRELLFDKSIKWLSPTDKRTTRDVMKDEIQDILTIYELMFKALELTLKDFFTAVGQKLMTLK